MVSRGLPRPPNRAVLGAVVRVSWLFALSLAPAPAAAGERTEALSQPAPVGGGCTILPADNVWNARVDLLPVHPGSDAWVAEVGAEGSLAPIADSASAPSQEAPGLLFYEIDRPAPKRDVTFQFVAESDPGPYPIPDEGVAALEGRSDPSQMILLDRTGCVLYELYDVRVEGRGLVARSGAVYPLRSNELRPSALVPADRSGLPLFPGLLRFEELERGEILHALRFSAPAAADSFVWPARRAAILGSDLLPPVGQRFRLRENLDLAPFSPRVRVLLRALQRYGMILAAPGGPWSLSSASDGAWSEEEISELATVRGSDFVAVDASLLRVAPDSGRVRAQPEIRPSSSRGSPFQCTATAGLACAGSDRFAVSVDWVDADETMKPARIASFRSDESVLFWFYEPSNWELMVKVIDGCAVNGHHWVFFAGTTDRGFALTVADSSTGDRLVYSSPSGQAATAVTDSDAFPTCAR